MQHGRGKIQEDIMKKRLLGVGLSILLAAGLAGCQTEGKKETQSAPAETASETAGAESAAEKTEEAAKTVDPKSVKLAYVSMNLANPWNATVKKGFEAACEELGCEYISIDSEYKVDKQVASLESLVNDKYSGFVFTPIDPNATWDIVEQAKAQGVATATIAQQQDNVNLIYGMKEYDYGHTIGTQAGQWIKDNLGGKAKVAIISQDNVESVIARGDGVEDALKEICPDVEIVARQAGDTLEGGMKIVESVLAQTPDLNVVVGTNDSGAIGGYQAMVNAGMTGEDKAVFSGDATAEAIEYIGQEDSIYRGTVDLEPYVGGYNCAKILYKYATEGIPAEQQIEMLNYKPVPKQDVLDGTFKAVQ